MLGRLRLLLAMSSLNNMKCGYVVSWYSLNTWLLIVELV